MLKRPHYIAIGTVVLLALILLNLPSHTVARLKLAVGSVFLPLFGLANSADQVANKAGDAITTRSELLRQNESLRRENQELKLQAMQAQETARENLRLRQLVGWQQTKPWKLKLGKIVLRDPGNWWHTVQIDLGSRDGVRLKVKTVTAFYYHSYCAILDGAGPDVSALKCWGSNDYCELGLGTDAGGTVGKTGDAVPFVNLGQTGSGGVRKAVALAGGDQFICVLGDDGAVLCWGDNLAGQLGLGFSGPPRSCASNETGDANRVSLPAPAVAIAARGGSDGRGAHACALL